MWLEIILIGIGLSMDAFAVAICKGLNMQRLDGRKMLLIALYFGGFQALMPFIGWLLGTRFRHLIESIDHWIAFGLLAFIGGKMLLEGIRKCFRKTPSEEPVEEEKETSHKELLLLAVATSIDALAVGISFAALGTPIFPAVLIIGCITFFLSMLGVLIGRFFENRLEKAAEILGGVILILIGIKILVEHLFT